MGLAVVGGAGAKWVGLVLVGGLALMGGALTRPCRINSVALNFQEPGCCMSSSKVRLVMVKLRVKGIRGGTPGAAGEGKRPILSQTWADL